MQNKRLQLFATYIMLPFIFEKNDKLKLDPDIMYKTSFI